MNCWMSILVVLLDFGKNTIFFLFKKKILFIYFLERGRVGEREGEKHQYVVASLSPPTGDLTHKPRCMPWLVIKPVTLWFTDQHPITEPHQPEQNPQFSMWPNFPNKIPIHMSIRIFSNVCIMITCLSGFKYVSLGSRRF